MVNASIMSCVEKSIRDIRASDNEENGRYLFGGITVVFGGDFRQV